MYFKNITDAVGNTPLVSMQRLSDVLGVPANIYAKLEYYNPLSSIKDRIAVAMLDDAEQKGLIKQGDTIVEPTSGNTGVALSFACAARGYKFIAVMPDSLSKERVAMMRHNGAEVILTDAKKTFVYAYELAKEIGQKDNHAILNQFENHVNPLVHYEMTAPEIWEALNGNIDVFVAGIGTGGTISGIGKYLKEKNPNIKVFGIEPAESPFLTTGKIGPNGHGIEGIGDSFEPPVLDRSVIDEILLCKTADAIATAKTAASRAGIACGISSGAALNICFELAKQPEFKGKNIVTICASAADRYFSTPLFHNETN